MPKSLRQKILSLVFIGLLISNTAYAQQEVNIKATKLSDSIYMLQGAGGHIGISIGDDGVVMIDDQFAPLSEKIKATIAEITDKPIRFVINTHWHGDHVGGNANFANEGSMIVAHKNVRERMSTDQFMELFQREVKAAPEEALPVITFKKMINFHLNGDEIRVIHVPHAHTDGDAIIHFVTDNIVHAGDTVFSGTYPFIDVGSGGTVTGFLENLEGIIAISDEDTQIIPGHGPLTNKAGMIEYHRVLSHIYSNYLKLKNSGKSFEEIQAIGISNDYDESYGKGFIKPDVFLKLIDASYAVEHSQNEASTVSEVKSKTHHHGAGQTAHKH